MTSRYILQRKSHFFFFIPSNRLACSRTRNALKSRTSKPSEPASSSPDHLNFNFDRKYGVFHSNGLISIFRYISSLDRRDNFVIDARAVCTPEFLWICCLAFFFSFFGGFGYGNLSEDWIMATRVTLFRRYPGFIDTTFLNKRYVHLFLKMYVSKFCRIVKKIE